MKQARNKKSGADQARVAASGLALNATANDVVASRHIPPRLLMIVGLLVLVPLILPGDTQWINDEPNIIDKAYRANQSGTLAERGLRGTVGLDYGPFPIWIYQGMLLLTHNPIALVAIRALLVSLATAAALLWLSRTLRLMPVFICVILLSPYLWLYSRALWDNSFCIPLCALLLAAHASYIERPRAWVFGMIVFCMAGLLLTHMMSLPLVAPVAVHLLAWHWRTLMRHVVAGLPVGVGLGFMALPYIRYIFSAKLTNEHPSGPEAWLFTLMGGRFLSAWGLDHFFEEAWFESAGTAFRGAFNAAVMVSLAGIVLVWAGMAMGAVEVARGISRRSVSTRVHVIGVCLAAWLMQTLLNGIARTAPLPHYFNATWICFALVAWHVVDQWQRKRAVGLLLGAYGAALAFVLVFLVVNIHQNNGSRKSFYGPSIATQWDVAQQLNAYSPRTRVIYDTRLTRENPQALAVLRKLDTSRPAVLKTADELHVRYRSRNNVNSELGVFVARPRPPASAPTR